MIVYTCANCKHYISDRKCNAFSEKIPDVIWQGDSGHEKLLSNQENDIIFEPIPKEPVENLSTINTEIN